ncbi:MAG: hypothetical protein NC548_56215 [Lachnospiraceae bacterium]|nr:hypothetical protein [Lachnospiraceae bacterium]
MTNKQLIQKMLAKGFTQCGKHNYGKKVGEITVIVSLTPNDTATTGEWRMPSFKEIMNGSIFDTFCSYTANGLNQALCKRKYF